MRRILLLMAVAAMVLTVTAGPALAQADPTQPPSTNEEELLNAHNCVGIGSADFGAGQGGLPGSKVSPAPGFTDPETGGPTFNGPVTSFFAQEEQGLGEFFPSSGFLDCGGPAGENTGPA